MAEVDPAQFGRNLLVQPQAERQSGLKSYPRSEVEPLPQWIDFRDLAAMDRQPDLWAGIKPAFADLPAEPGGSKAGLAIQADLAVEIGRRRAYRPQSFDRLAADSGLQVVPALAGIDAGRQVNPVEAGPEIDFLRLGGQGSQGEGPDGGDKQAGSGHPGVPQSRYSARF